MNNKIFGFLGLAKRAGKVDTGEQRVRDRIKSGNAFLVILAEDASENTRKKITDMCNFRDIELIVLSDRYTLGSCVGKEFAVVLSVSDKGFAEKIKQLFNED